jgi:hypothetical protein
MMNFEMSPACSGRFQLWEKLLHETRLMDAIFQCFLGIDQLQEVEIITP